MRLLQALRDPPDPKTHLVVRDRRLAHVQEEHGLKTRGTEALAHQVHDNANVGAAIASGSFQCARDGCGPAPCARWRYPTGPDNLLTRAADVM